MKHFQPCPLCGNCRSYRKSVKVNDQVVEPADCAKKQKPVRKAIYKVAESGREEKQAWTCEEFGHRNKKNKRMKNRMKKWERQFSY